ncbi:MAG: 3-keto-5-aminohexanoate cleavage protein [Porticoccaceae bacterium]
MEKLIIEARVNEYASRGDNPHVPWTAPEIADCAAECRAAGAAIVHFHARNGDGSPAHDVGSYRDAIAGIRALSDVLVHPTLGAFANDGDARQRLAPVLELARDAATRPDLAPLDMGSANIDAYADAITGFATSDRVYVNTTGTLDYFATQLARVGVKPYAVIWNLSFLRQFLAFLEMGRIARPAYVCLTMTEGGLLAAHPGTAAGLAAYRLFLPDDPSIHWTVCNHGGNLLPLAGNIIAAGGHVSIGLGDWPYREMGRPTNADVVAAVVKLARSLGREVATPAEARRILGVADAA